VFRFQAMVLLLGTDSKGFRRTSLVLMTLKMFSLGRTSLATMRGLYGA